MKKIKICAVVTGSSLKEFLENLDQVQEISELVELRVDKIKNLNEKDLLLIRKKTIKEAIFTCRDKKIILQAMKIGFDYVDIEFNLIKKIDFEKPKDTKIIISYHDFKKTPSGKELEKITSQMKKYKNDTIKIATLIIKKSDNLKLFGLLLNKKIEERMIIVGMGEKGKITRILGPILGSYLTYASTKFGKTAPGQIDVIKLKKIYKLIN
jgi:3-dehydroquinate dehydratase I